MKVLSIGGGPAGLYFALLYKQSHPGAHITVLERNQRSDTFGFGVVFSDATMGNLAAADPESHAAITKAFTHWQDIDVHYRGGFVRSTGHGFAGLGRRQLLDILYARCEALGIELRFGVEARLPAPGEYDLVLAADGVASGVRTLLAEHLGPSVDLRPNRFVWLGTSFPYAAFTFYFKDAPEGLWRIHAYRYAADESTFIAECREDTWRAAGLDRTDEDGTIAHLERVFADELAGHRLRKNRSIWRQFPNVRNARWHHGNVVLMGDAAHTAHFSIGSGTKLALEDAIALHEAVCGEAELGAALTRYERERRPAVESTQRAAQHSLEWFETTERYVDLPPPAFAASLFTRSLRVTHNSLKLRDPALATRFEEFFAEAAAVQTGAPQRTAPPMFQPFRLRDLTLDNRVVVSPMCQYSAPDDGLPTDWHLVHLGSRAVGGAGLVIAEMTAVSAAGRITPACAGMYKDEHAAAWQRVVEFVHAHSRTKIGLQLGHAGRKGATCVPWQGGEDVPLEAGRAWGLCAASALPWRDGSPVPVELDRAGMVALIAEYVAAARRAAAAGFDLLELHAAHGYLLASFISPLTNRRGDAYGGTLAGRARFPLEVVEAVRAAWPAMRPLSVRISASDWAEGGIGAADVVALARLLREHGVDVIDVSSGQTVAHQRPRYGRLYQTPLSELVRLEAGVPTITVGAISTAEDVNSVLLAGRADLIALARAHLYDPYFTLHAAQEQQQPPAWPAQYASLARFNPRPR